MSRAKGTTRLNGPVTVQDEGLLSDKDWQRLDQVNRNALIRRQYSELKAKHGWEEARKILAERHSVSPHTVQMVLEERR